MSRFILFGWAKPLQVDHNLPCCTSMNSFRLNSLYLLCLKCIILSLLDQFVKCIQLIPTFFHQPLMAHGYKNNRGTWKPSLKESSDGFILHVKVILPFFFKLDGQLMDFDHILTMTVLLLISGVGRLACKNRTN